MSAMKSSGISINGSLCPNSSYVVNPEALLSVSVKLSLSQLLGKLHHLW